MERPTYRTELFCPRCGRETPHVVSYISLWIKSISCLECHLMLAKSSRQIQREYLRALPVRARELIGDLMDEARHRPGHFVHKLPYRLAVKPLKISRELYTVWVA
jgi:hypothetical protein